MKSLVQKRVEKFLLKIFTKRLLINHISSICFAIAPKQATEQRTYFQRCCFQAFLHDQAQFVSTLINAILVTAHFKWDHGLLEEYSPISRILATTSKRPTFSLSEQPHRAVSVRNASRTNSFCTSTQYNSLDTLMELTAKFEMKAIRVFSFVNVFVACYRVSSM